MCSIKLSQLVYFLRSNCLLSGLGFEDSISLLLVLALKATCLALALKMLASKPILAI